MKRQTDRGCCQPPAKRATPKQPGRHSLEYTIGTDPSHPEGNHGIETIQESDGERAVKDGARRSEFRHMGDRTRMCLLPESPLSARLMRPLAGNSDPRTNAGVSEQIVRTYSVRAASSSE
jgi:hypothetical protein